MSCILYTLKVHVIPTKCTVYKIQVYVLTIILYTQKAERARWAARGRDQKKKTKEITIERDVLVGQERETR